MTVMVVCELVDRGWEVLCPGESVALENCGIGEEIGDCSAVVDIVVYKELVTTGEVLSDAAAPESVILRCPYR